VSKSRTRATVAAGAAAALVLSGVALAAPAIAAPAAPTASASKQLAKCGFTKTPNVTAFDNGTATLSKNKAKQYKDVVITGKAPSAAAAGTKLTLMRYSASKKCDAQGQATNIHTTVNKNGTYTLHMQLGRVGTYGYSLGYGTGGTAPEEIEVLFQFTTVQS
jgi:hypothetical protein